MRQELDEKTGIVSIYNKDGKIALNFQFDGKRKRFGLGLDYNDHNLGIAIAKAKQLESDIIFNRFDGDIKKYKIGYNPNIRLVDPVPKLVELKPKLDFSIKDCWELYKTHKQALVVESTIKRRWPERDNVIRLLDNQNLLGIDQASDALTFLLKKYSYTTIDKIFRDFRSATNLATKLGKYEGKNYYSVVLELFPKKTKKGIQSFTKEEIETIINAFESNEYMAKHSAYKSSYFTNLIKFRFLVGSRPSETIALTWDDIYESNGFTWIKFNKAFVDNCLQLTTKTKEIRVFQCYPQLRQFIESLPVIPNENNLIFPSNKGKGYICLRRFCDTYWRPIVRDGLLQDGLISKYLPFYDQRHTCGTLLLQSGLDIQTIAKMLGNSSEVLLKHYLASKEDLSDLPNLF